MIVENRSVTIDIERNKSNMTLLLGGYLIKGALRFHGYSFILKFFTNSLMFKGFWVSIQDVFVLCFDLNEPLLTNRENGLQFYST